MTILESAALSGGETLAVSQYNSLLNDMLNRMIVPGGRLTAGSGNPVGLIGAGQQSNTIYYTPWLHNRIPLWDGTRWVVKEFSEISLSVSSFKRNEIKDIFIYDNAGTLTLESQAWAQTTVTAGATAGSSVTISVASTTGASTGDIVLFENGNIAEITAVSSGVSITVDVLGNNLSIGDYVFYNVRSADLGTQNSVLVKNGDATRRYLGSAKSNVASNGVVADLIEQRSLYNYYNQIFKPFKAVESTSHSYSSTTVRKWNNASTNARIPFLIGVKTHPIRAEFLSLFEANSDSNRPQVGLGIDDISAFNTDVGYTEYRYSRYVTLGAGANVALDYGFHYLHALEAAASGGGTFDNITIKGGMFA